MVIGRLLGWLLLLAALAVLGRDLIAWHATGHFVPIATGQLWYDLDRGSLNLAQAAIQRHVATWLWNPVVTTILSFWAVLVLAVPGLLLLWACRRRGYSRRRRWS
jgi:hypothetical protein